MQNVFNQRIYCKKFLYLAGLFPPFFCLALPSIAMISFFYFSL
ncbi:hypothetical protein HMPREF0294_1718 [Corynebacterium glucuronolyticum ATCC 51867]|uniref:Uncharacterized protein n=1 Tax=Corynebacterium glucuronolyticum ATCC 51866 TaxID=548478 RepID=A0ABP2DRL4_9CORY|nr:hypothetical protein HMPREF0294_1718 [Corynebacterium glucuronolyticum ATCC 51867]EEI61953.1 hypothetical protein HMPREF0293_2491 [Corynebacterium glucuronolyticum ATCC 51866]